MIGKKLAHYEICSQLGAGGMGEVYRATDTRLERSVAIKILPKLFANDPDRITRFEREAKLLAALNHPNIAAIHGLEKSGSTLFLVLELIEGETLAEQIARGPMATGEAIELGVQIAEALEAAHEKGVVHRDLKPANIKITPNGQVKVLDFGLAKAFATEQGETQLSQSPTLSVSATNAGIILGTAAYMSPEQAKGRPVDKRTDLFAFGCVLFEMLTGHQLFQGETIAEVLGCILVREPDLSRLPANLNPRIRGLIERCLEKDVKKRWQAAGDLRVELETVLADPQGVDIQPAPKAQPTPRWRSVALVGIAALVGALIAAAAILALRSEREPEAVQLSFLLPEGQNYSATGDNAAVISPDGKNIVYQAGQQLYLRPMGEREPRLIQGSGLGGPIAVPTFSPDGQWVAFWHSGGMLKKIPINGGVAVTLCPAANVFGADWNGDRIIFAQPERGILEVPDAGGKPEVRVPIDPGELAAAPQLLPGGDAVLFTSTKSTGSDRWNNADIFVHSKKSGQRKKLFAGGFSARYVPTGHIVYASGANLFSVPFDLARLELAGGPVAIQEGIRRGSFTGLANFSFSRTGTFVFVPADAGSNDGIQRSLGLVDRNGKVEVLKIPRAHYDSPRISPDGKQLVVRTSDEGGTIWVYGLSGNASLQRLTFEPSNFPLWSADGQKVIFQGVRDGKQAILSQAADGSAPAESLMTAPGLETQLRPESASHDGKTLLFMMVKSGDAGLSALEIASERKVETFLDLPNSRQDDSAFSPDGHWLAYKSTETGVPRIYVEPFPRTGARYQISRETAVSPAWSADGKQLFYYLIASNKLMSVPIVHTGSSLSIGEASEAVTLSRDAFVLPNSGHRQYDVTPDKRFLIVFSDDRSQTPTRAPQQVHFVLNWFAELKKKVPVR